MKKNGFYLIILPLLFCFTRCPNDPDYPTIVIKDKTLDYVVRNDGFCPIRCADFIKSTYGNFTNSYQPGKEEAFGTLTRTVSGTDAKFEFILYVPRKTLSVVLGVSNPVEYIFPEVMINDYDWKIHFSGGNYLNVDEITRDSDTHYKVEGRFTLYTPLSSGQSNYISLVMFPKTESTSIIPSKKLIMPIYEERRFITGSYSRPITDFFDLQYSSN